MHEVYTLLLVSTHIRLAHTCALPGSNFLLGRIVGGTSHSKQVFFPFFGKLSKLLIHEWFLVHLKHEVQRLTSQSKLGN